MSIILAMLISLMFTSVPSMQPVLYCNRTLSILLDIVFLVIGQLIVRLKKLLLYLRAPLECPLVIPLSRGTNRELSSVQGWNAWWLALGHTSQAFFPHQPLYASAIDDVDLALLPALYSRPYSFILLRSVCRAIPSFLAVRLLLWPVFSRVLLIVSRSMSRRVTVSAISLTRSA